MTNSPGPMLCPIDGSTLTMSERSGIEIDYCPQCRGVWLDRGELEKLMASEGGSDGSSVPPMPQQSSRYEEPRRYDRDHDDRYKRKKRDSIFDIFD